MKVHFKRLAAAAVAVAMSLSLNVSAFAAEVPTGTLTVTGNELAGKNVFAVRMFTAVANENEDSYIFTDYELEDKWLSFFGDIDYSEYNADSDNDTDITEPVDAKEALAYMEWLKNGDEEQWAAFAEDAQDWLYKQGVIEVTGEPENRVVSIAADWSDLAAMETATEVEPVEVNEAPSGNATFESLTSGYYVVFPEGGSTGISNRGTDAMLINIPTDHAGATWNIKSTYPTVDKMVNDGNENTPDKDGADAGNADNGSAQVGDTVTFTLKSTVPDMSDYDKFYFAFNDTLSNGLQVVNSDKTVVADGDNVTIDNLTVTIGAENVSDYTVSLHDNVLKVEFTDLKSVEQANQSEDIGKAIVVTYQAKITEAAVSGSDNIVGNAQNDVYLEYSNNPSTTDKGTSTPDTSKVYTYDIDVDKYELVKDTADSDDDNDTEEMIEQGLAGAKFVLSKDKTLNGTGLDGYTNAIAITTAGNNTYKVDPTGSTYEFTTVANADITIEGLEAGTYYLHEVAAPTGYNKLKDPVEIKIIVDAKTAATYAPDGNEGKYNNVSFENPLYVVNGTANANANDATIKVENKKGIELPETGSIGTIGLTVAGVVIVAIGLFAMPRKKKDQD